eukprot:TRINITY_DN19746_c0_g1_i1.p1 TRINITY_DN19746_c0_g1~~TRINITY_DN19746_c0_g1_i1.p1  ORF type:complete len:265 (-),score=125.01 TRINITY_DN19746_c0_g1_i1:4-750(-)
MPTKLVLVRHGESTWNSENRFTGWTDVDLSEKGVQEAHAGGAALRDAGYEFDVAYTSMLKRAVRTMWIILDELDALWLPTVRTHTLNERHYGALQGLNKSETAKRHGDDQVKIWRRSFDVPPPALEKTDPRWPGNQAMYGELEPATLPTTESLKDTIDRCLPFWFGSIAPDVKAGRKVLVVAHGNSLRGLVKHLEGLSEEQIVELNLPTGIPLVYELDAELRPVKKYFLGDEATVMAAQAAVANQGRA